MSDVVAEQKVVRTMKAVKARERHCWQERAETDAGNGEAVRSTHL